MGKLYARGAWTLTFLARSAKIRQDAGPPCPNPSTWCSLVLRTGRSTSAQPSVSRHGSGSSSAPRPKRSSCCRQLAMRARLYSLPAAANGKSTTSGFNQRMALFPLAGPTRPPLSDVPKHSRRSSIGNRRPSPAHCLCSCCPAASQTYWQASQSSSSRSQTNPSMVVSISL